MAALITRENLGAWLIRCNPGVWDLPTFVRDGGDWIENWTVRRNYRSGLMKPVIGPYFGSLAMGP